MALNTIADLSVTPASNTDLLGQSTSGTSAVSTLDNMIRNHAGIMARFYADIGGVMTVGGSANAITVTSNSTYQTLKNGLIIAFKAASANTGATTLNLDSLGAKAVRRQGDSALLANDIAANGTYLVRYDTAYNSAAGAWVLLNPANSSVWQKGTDVASAATVSLGDGGFFHITGTTTITDIDFATATDGRIAHVVFDGALTLTHNATTLILPGAANITTAAGDRAIFVQDSGDNVICISYTKADGTPVVAQAGITLGTAAASTSGTSVDYTGLPSTVKRWTLNLSGISTNGTSGIIVQIGPSGGVETSGYNGSGGTTVTAWSTGAIIIQASSAAVTMHGTITGVLLESSTNTWAITGTIGRSDIAGTFVTSGSKALAGALSRIRLTTVGGADTFDAGKINITYE